MWIMSKIEFNLNYWPSYVYAISASSTVCKMILYMHTPLDNISYVLINDRWLSLESIYCNITHFLKRLTFPYIRYFRYNGKQIVNQD